MKPPPDRPDDKTAGLVRELREQCRRAGFADFGIVPASEPETFAAFEDFLAEGYHGEMGYLERGREARRHPRSILPGVRSVVMLTMPFRVPQRPPGSPPRDPSETQPPPTGRISRYAHGESDYHDLIRARLKSVTTWLKRSVADLTCRAVVDTAPLLERDFARRAGLGWIGKNTMLISPGGGSDLFLAAILLDQDWSTVDPPAVVTDHCGGCTACLDACPTDAFVGPHVLNATRCLSYWTIEAKSLPPPEIRERVGDWIFGCDVCNDVCPWNRNGLVSLEPSYRPAPASSGLPPGEVDLVDVLSLDEAGFHARFGSTPIARTGRTGLLRNAAILCGANRHVAAVPALIGRLTEPDAVVRAATVWALGQMDTPDADAALSEHLHRETDPLVLVEVPARLKMPSS